MDVYDERKRANSLLRSFELNVTSWGNSGIWYIWGQSELLQKCRRILSLSHITMADSWWNLYSMLFAASVILVQAIFKSNYVTTSFWESNGIDWTEFIGFLRWQNLTLMASRWPLVSANLSSICQPRIEWVVSRRRLSGLHRCCSLICIRYQF